MRKNENSHNKKDYVISGMFYSLWGFILLFCMLLLFATTGHCASAQSPKLPILVENIDVAPYQGWINSRYGGFLNLSQDNVIGWGSQENGYFVQTFAIPQVPSDIASYFSFTNPPGMQYNYPNIDYPNITITMTFENLANDNYRPWRLITFYTNGNNGPGYPYADAFNTASTINKGVYGNTGAVLNYVSSDICLTSSGQWLEDMPVFVNEIPIVPILPDDTASADMEKPDLDDYIPTWDNMPQFDNSDIPSAISSVYNIIKWVGENVRDTIVGLGKFIGDTIRWGLQKVIDTIRSKIDEIKGVINDIKGFVSDIKDFVGYVAEPLDVSSVQSTITGSTAFGDVSTITGAFADFKGVFDNTTEPSEYKIPFHLESIAILNQTQTQYIDLSVIANQRGLIRAFCWVVTTFSLFVTVVDALPNYLKGGDE